MAAITQPRPANSSIRAPLFILGVALALVAFIVMFAFGLLFANRTVSGTTVPVVVAAGSIDARSPITPLDIKMASAPQSVVPANAFRSLSQLTGQYAMVDIPVGQILGPNIVAPSPDSMPISKAFLDIPAGWEAFTIPAGEQIAVGGYIAAGDYIKVVATVNTQMFTQKNPRQVTKIVFTGVHVIRVGPATNVPGQGQAAPGVTSSLTVVMTACDVAYLTWLLANATVRYSLDSFHDYGTAAGANAAPCTATGQLNSIGPAAVNARWDFLGG